MSITNTTRVVTFTGNGATTAWPFTFLIPSEAIEVELIEIATGIVTPVAAIDYTVVGLDSPTGGTVTYPLVGAPLAATHKITVYRSVPATQPVTITNQTRYYAKVVMGVWDRLTMMVQDLKDNIERSPKVPVGSSVRGLTLPEPVSGNALVGNATGTGWIDGPSTGLIAGAQQSAIDAATSAALAQDWAESPTPPDVGDPTSKSSKTWAGDAATSAAQAALYDGIRLDNVAAVIADTALTYTPAQPSTVVAGDYVNTRAEGFSYEVAASSASDHHLTTAGGVKLYALAQAQQWSIVGRPAPVVVSSGGSGPLTGTYYWSVSYVTDEGETETGIGASGTLASQEAALILPISPDRRVIARNVYRTLAGSLEPQDAFFVATVSDNSTTSFTDNTPTGLLGVPAPHINTTGGKLLNGSDIIGSVSTLSTTFGVRAMPEGRGYACTAIGSQALENNAGGYRNVAVGTNALDANSTGFNNTGVGVHALDRNTTGNNNTAIGLGSLFNVVGSQNTAVGSRAGGELTTGSSNTFFGANAGRFRTGGDSNTFIGDNAGFAAAPDGQSNVGVGVGALQAQTGGNFNTAVGRSSLPKMTSAGNNVSVGYASLNNNIVGPGNVAVGAFAGYWETRGSRLWIDNNVRADLSDAEEKALIYGKFGATRADQFLNVNGQVNPLAGIGMVTRTVTTNGTITVNDTAIVCNKAGGTLILTLPITTDKKVLHIKNIQAHTVEASSSVVRPIDSEALGTSILPATAGAWCMLVADGGYWRVMSRGT